MVAISSATRHELVRAVSERYRTSVSAKEKGRILDEFVALSGYHRKHAIRVLNGFTGTTASTTRGRLRLYDEAVRQALIVFWEASDRICGKRLKPLLPVLLPALEGHGHVKLDPTVRAQLLAVSAATIDRMLSGARAAAGGRRSRAKTTPAVRRRVPVRTFADWHEPAPGFVEADLVVHCGESMAGSFASTLVLTDIASGWTECIALLVREASLIVDALDRLRVTLPFPLRGIDTDNGSEFINELLITFCTDHGIKFTRSRPYRKNDQAWVEQKNGSVVRRLVGYGRLEGVASGDALARLYSASRLFVNFFQPSFKLAKKERVGAHVRKRYHAPETPCARLLASTDIAESMKDRLRAVLGTLDPLRLLDEIRTVQHHLAALAAGEHIHVLPHRHADLDTFLKSLAHAWRDGEVRPTHRKGPKPPRHWRTRKDPFETTWPRVVTWLESEPNRTAKELFARLRGERPGDFSGGQLRTLQRRVTEWRRLTARRFVFAEPLADLGHDVATCRPDREPGAGIDQLPVEGSA
jgi:Integrase core domain